jgi:glutamate synthase domain-containing protein 2
MRKLFLFSFILLFAGITLIALYYPKMWWSLMVVFPLFLLGIYDIIQHRHTILRNFPIIGHFRYLLESIGPEMRQYFVESDISGRPFTRLQRAFVYKRAKKTLETHPFGTELNVYEPGYMWLAHSMYPKEELSKPPRVKVGGKECTQPYMASILNVSAMSFGSLGERAVRSLNKGAKLGGFYQNTGEGGLTKYHLEEGGDLVWQIGTAYFGARDAEGNFSDEIFARKAVHPNVKMIEIKLSQGAKPGLGGVLPAHKNTVEIAEIRGLIPHTIVHSPPGHKEFADGKGMLLFVQRLRKLSGGKPVGFKLCIGSRQEFIKICEAMVETRIYPDFITVDGGEGGTGAAPIEFSDNVGMPLFDALVFVCDTLNGYGLKKEIKVIASCKVLSGFDIIKNICVGADMCNSARAMLFSIGCIQAIKCDTNRCPTGITTQDKQLQAGLNVEDKSVRAANFHKETVKSAMALLTSAGLDDLGMLNRSYIYKRLDENRCYSLEHLYPSVKYGAYLHNEEIMASGEQERHHVEGQPQPRTGPVDSQKRNDYPSPDQKED